MSAHAHRHTHKHMQHCVCLSLRQCDSCAGWGFVVCDRVRQGGVPKNSFGLSGVQHQLASTGILHQTLTTPLSVSRLSLWNVYDSGAVDKMEIDLDWKANKIAKAQSQLKNRQREQGGGGEKESKRRKCINTGLALREHRVMSTSSTHTEYWGENMDTPSWPADWCRTCASACVCLCLIRLPDCCQAWDFQLLPTDTILVLWCVWKGGHT